MESGRIAGVPGGPVTGPEGGGGREVGGEGDEGGGGMRQEQGEHMYWG